MRIELLTDAKREAMKQPPICDALADLLCIRSGLSDGRYLAAKLEPEYAQDLLDRLHKAVPVIEQRIAECVERYHVRERERKEV